MSELPGPTRMTGREVVDNILDLLQRVAALEAQLAQKPAQPAPEVPHDYAGNWWVA